MLNKILYIIAFVTFLFFSKASAQISDSVPYKNNLKYNLSAPMLWGKKNFVLEYERILSSNRSISFTFGYRSFPKLIGVGKSDSAFIVRNHKNLGGFSSTIDYRFYLTNENKYAAPRGIYIAPYVNYFSNKFENKLSTFYLDVASLTMETKVEVLSAGAQLGYQFVFYDRISFDICILGPSVSWYNVKLKLEGEAEIKNEELFNKFSGYVVEKYPVVGLLFDEYKFSGGGRTSKISFGYRYYFKVGYLF